MSFALRMALRELRRSRRRFVFFLLCIAIGVAGLVGVKGFNASLQQALLREARTLMAADMQVTLSQQPSERGLKALDALRAEGIQIVHNTETVSMAINPANRETKLVEVKAVEPGYPFYGVLEVNPSASLSAETALVAGELLDLLGLQVGDPIRIGSAVFKVSGVIIKEPDRVITGFSAGPRVMIDREGLKRANLIQVGSRARQIFLLKLPDERQVEAVRARLRAAFEGERARVADFREAQPTVRRFLDRMTSFLSLVSMVSLLVGGLGVANATRVFIQQKLDTIAILKSMGATNRQVISVYLLQMLLLSLLGSTLGLLFGFAIQRVMPEIAGSFLNVEVTLGLSPEVALQGLTVGLLTAMLFTLIPLLSISDVKPLLVFRREMSERRSWTTWRQRLRELSLYGLVAAGLAAIAAWVSGRPLWGLYFMGGLMAAVLILGAASSGAVLLVRKIRVPRSWLTVRQGLANIHRPGSQASAIVLALGIGVTMVLAIYLMQRGLSREVAITAPPGAPNMFFFGIQAQNVDQFQKLLTSHPGVEKAPDPTPIVRGRLVSINGKGKADLNLNPEDERWFDFEFSLTSSEAIPTGNELISGPWWTPRDRQGRLLVSVEQEAAQRLKIALGSVIELNVEGGLPIKAEVFNVRRTVDFRAGGGFNFVFTPESLEGVPKTYLAQARVNAAATSSLQKSLANQFPSLTIVNVGDILKTVGDLLNRIGFVIRFVAGFSVAAGLIILSSSIAATKFRRTREAVLYKTLGASRGIVWRIFATEYAALGLVAGLVGAFLSSVTAWVMLKYVMEIKYTLELLPLTLGVLIMVVLTIGVGVLSTLDVLRAKPLQVLREE